MRSWKLDIPILGHRLRLLRAIAAFSEAAAPAAAASTLRPTLQAVASGVERRQLTVMFCDLVGSTALSDRLDPEDVRAVVRAYQTLCSEVVERYDGHVAQYPGDGLMVYFGWPRAHEDDAQRALRAGLDMLSAINQVPSLESLQIKIGIATGAVVVGGTAANESSAQQLAVGETPNLASRVQALAGADEIVIAASTFDLAGGSFECQYLGQHVLKGIVAPVRAWRVRGESQAEGRFQAARGTGLTVLVGREPEIAMLMESWAQAREGEGRAVLLSGEPGIGKSRVTDELCKRVASEPHRRFHYQCSPYHTNSAFYPIICQLERAAGFDRSDTPEAKLDKLEALLASWGGATPTLEALYAALLSLPLARYPALQLRAQKQKQQTIEAIVDTLISLSTSQPVLMIFEDAHWIDPTTLETLSAVVDGITDSRVLLVLTARPEFEPPWSGHSHVTVHSLNRLSRRQSVHVIETVTQGKVLPQEIRDQIVAKTDGVPLFLEEVTKRVLASDALHSEADRYVLHGRLSELEIPATLKDSLTARLDQLGAAKKVAQIGAVIGRQFSYEMVAALCGLASAQLVPALEQLVDFGLVSRRGLAPDAVYTFRHALIQDAAYESLLKRERQALHARAGDILSESFSETGESAPELLARHYAAGNVNDKAVEYWLKAGQKAWQRSAAKEAIAHLTRGLELVETIGDVALHEGLELKLQAALGVIYFAAISYAAPQAQGAFLRAYELCERVQAPELQAPVLYGIGAFQSMKGDIRAGHNALEKLMAVASASRQPRFLLYTHSVLTWSSYNRGEYAAAIEHAEQARSRYFSAVQTGPRLSAADPKVISESFRAAALWSLGFADQATQASDSVLEHARALGDTYSLAYSLNFAALIVADLCGDYERIVERAEEGIELARELGYPFMEVFGTLWRAWANSQSGDPAEALAIKDKALVRCRELGVRYHYPKLLTRRARLAHSSRAHRECARDIRRSPQVRGGVRRVFAGGRCASDTRRYRPRCWDASLGGRRSVLSDSVGNCTPAGSQIVGAASCQLARPTLADPRPAATSV